MKTTIPKPSIKLPTIKMPKPPSVGIKAPRLPGFVNPLRLNK